MSGRRVGKTRRHVFKTNCGRHPKRRHFQLSSRWLGSHVVLLCSCFSVSHQCWTMWISGPGIDINMIDICQYNHLSRMELARGLCVHVVPAHRTASPIALKIVATLQVVVVVWDCSFPFYLITSTPTSVIPKIFIPSLLSLGHCVQHNDLGLWSLTRQTYDVSF